MAYQRDAHTVEALDLETGTREALAVPAEPDDLPECPVGSVMACGDRIWFLPWHGEALHELRSGAVVARGLPEKERPARRALLRHAHRFRAAAREARVELGLCQFRAMGDGPRRVYAATEVAEMGRTVTAYLLATGPCLPSDDPRLCRARTAQHSRRDP